MAGGNVGNNLTVKAKGDTLSFPVKIATAIYRNTLVAVDSTGYLVQAAGTSAMKFVGIAEEGCTAAEAVANGTVSIKVRRHGIYKMKNGTGTLAAITDVGKAAYLHTAHTASVDNDVTTTAHAPTAYNPVGLIVGYSASTSPWTYGYFMVDITPALWTDADVTTHAALADQTAHVQAGVAPGDGTASDSTDTTGTATISAAAFKGGFFTCAYGGASSITLPTDAGITVGTTCRIVKAHATAGLLTIAGGTLVGPQTASNSFYGCANNGDSVVIMAVGTNSFRVVSVSQKPSPVAKTADATLSAAEVASQPFVSATHASVAIAITLPAAAAGNAGSHVMVGQGGAAAVTVICAAGFGGGSTGKDTATLAQGDMCDCWSDGTSWYVNNLTSPA